MANALVVGSGPNGLAAAITVAQAGVDVTVVESADEIGGGLRSGELTLPGLVHDHCAAIVPTAVASPFIRSLELEAHGVSFAWPDIELAHPLDDGTAGVLRRSVADTCAALGADGARWKSVFGRMADAYDRLADDLLSPMVAVPRRPVELGLFGLPAMVPATALMRLFTTPQARAMIAGNAAHGWTPLSRPPTSAIALMFAAIAHRYGWPCVVGGTARLADGLASVLREHGGRIQTGAAVSQPGQLGGYDMVFFDTSPRLPADLLGDRIPARIQRALRRYRYGAAAFKLDLAVHEGIPWTNPEARAAGSLHVCGSAEEVAAAERDTFAGRMPQRPFLIVAQQYLMDSSRAVGELKPVYAYAHVPHGYTGDATGAVLAQIERFAPGFRDRIAAQRVSTPANFEQFNANFIGGDINGGSMDLRSFIARPRLSPNPYWLGVPGMYLCSAATPPGGGVHGMSGHLAARAALRRAARTR
ncbi:FAD-dependent oxidoreductase [Mycobacterium sp. MS1601]|uniref:phytoene desaturase family protein n=1 Tax=Mycobacterium sp. MS1601 TaxID=1936029 RepID=UPI00097943F0|nr:NAD(P)/FAD-dependent oxidoreductase [Mycobacterium sp. MS1601]AQA03245.1 FAD-dependent oxidoreductase [Mycobacterium sp. MS1601]